MKAAVFKEAGLVAVEDVPAPKAGPGQVVVRISYCGICGSDLHRYAHGLMAPGVIMGHEFAGVVTEVGERVREWSVGDRVVRGIKGRLQVANPRYSARDKGFTVDVQAPGGYAEYTAQPAIGLLRQPENITDEVAALAEPLADAVHTVRLGNVKLGDTVVVMGAGPIGLFTLQCARLAGPGLLVVSEPSPARREMARRLGADVVLDPFAVDVVEEAVRLSGGLGPDVVFECAGAKPTFQQAMEMARYRGQIVLVALCMDGCQISPLDWVGREVQLQCSYGTEIPDWHVALSLLASGRVQGEPVISRVVPLAEIQAAFQALLQPTDDLQVLVRP